MERKFFNSADALVQATANDVQPTNQVESTVQVREEDNALVLPPKQAKQTTAKPQSTSLQDLWQRLLNYLNVTNFDVVFIVLGNMVMAFSLVNIHIQANITEGGGIGLAILVNKMFGLNPAITSFVFDTSLYALGFILLERGFLRRALVSTVIFSMFYSFFFNMGPVLPSLADNPILAATLGGMMIGIGCGLVVTRGGVTGGDDCYALILSSKTTVSLSKAYFISDAIVLAASALIYLPLANVVISLYSTVISSFIIGQFELHLPELDFLWEERKSEAN